MNEKRAASDSAFILLFEPESQSRRPTSSLSSDGDSGSSTVLAAGGRREGQMKRRLFNLLAAVGPAICVLAFVGCAHTHVPESRLIAADPARRGAVSSPLTVLTGNDSHIKKEAFLRITSATDWKRTWLDHLGMKEDTIYRPAMEVDFTRCEVLVVFVGASVNTCGLRVDSITETDDAIVVRFDDVSYQTLFGKEDKGDQVSPYAFIVLPKANKVIVLEDNVQRYIGHAPEWKEVARLEASR